jgi:hypothetical protein
MNVSASLQVLISQIDGKVNIKEEYNKNVRLKVYGIFPFEQIQEFEGWVNSDYPPIGQIRERIDLWMSSYE